MWTLTAREVHDHTVVPKRRQDHLTGRGHRVRETLGEDELAYLKRQGGTSRNTQPELNRSLGVVQGQPGHGHSMAQTEAVIRTATMTPGQRRGATYITQGLCLPGFLCLRDHRVLPPFLPRCLRISAAAELALLIHGHGSLAHRPHRGSGSLSP